MSTLKDFDYYEVVGNDGLTAYQRDLVQEWRTKQIGKGRIRKEDGTWTPTPKQEQA